MEAPEKVGAQRPEPCERRVPAPISLPEPSRQRRQQGRGVDLQLEAGEQPPELPPAHRSQVAVRAGEPQVVPEHRATGTEDAPDVGGDRGAHGRVEDRREHREGGDEIERRIGEGQPATVGPGDGPAVSARTIEAIGQQVDTEEAILPRAERSELAHHRAGPATDLEHRPLVDTDVRSEAFVAFGEDAPVARRIGVPPLRRSTRLVVAPVDPLDPLALGLGPGADGW